MPTTTTTTTTTPRPTVITETALVGTDTNALANIEYSVDGSSVVHTEDLGSPIAAILYAEKTNKAYISTTDYLYEYAIGYYSGTKEYSQLLSVANGDASIISTYRKDDNSLWAVQSYNGKVVKMNPTTMAVVKTYDGFDAPHKIRYSAFHNAYFVAGSNILWKIDDVNNTITHVYEINGYTLKDFDVSESGIICMLFRGTTNDIIRIVNNDLYTFSLDKSVGTGTLAFCRYCNAGRFYILAELNSGSNVALYSAIHYLFTSATKTLNEVKSEDVLSVTTTTTTSGITTKAVKITSPNGGESIQIGRQYDIKWISSKSVNDVVKIELYKANVLYSVLSEKTTNTGIFSWNVLSDIEDGDDYKVKITWLAASSDSNNYDSSAASFSILQNVVTTTTTTTTKITEHAIGIDYASAGDQILIMLLRGQYMIFMLSNLTSYGLLTSGISNPSAMATRSMVISGQATAQGESSQTKVRIFVGSQMYLADKWDSGVIETKLKSMYYAGGNNLRPGEKYYLHIQTFSENEGWSDLQISDFVMVK